MASLTEAGRRRSRRSGQNTVEYLIMLAVVVGVVLIAGLALKGFMPELFAKVTAPIQKIFGGSGEAESSSAASESGGSSGDSAKPWSSILPGSGGGGGTLAGVPGSGGGGQGSNLSVGSGGSGVPSPGGGEATYSGGGGPSAAETSFGGSAVGSGPAGAAGSSPGGVGSGGTGLGSDAGAGGSATAGIPAPGGHGGAVPVPSQSIKGRDSPALRDEGQAFSIPGGGGASESGATGGSGGPGGRLGRIAADVRDLARSAATDPSARARIREAWASLSTADLRPPSEAAREKELDAALRAVEGLRKALRRWDKLDATARVRALQELADLFAKTYGITPPQVSAHDFSSDPGVLAYHSVEGKLLIDAAALKEPDGAVRTVLHQSYHRYQLDLVSTFGSGRLPTGDDRYGLAMILVADAASGPDAGDYRSYRGRPFESQAFRFEGVVSAALITLRRAPLDRAELGGAARRLAAAGSPVERLALGGLVATGFCLILGMAAVAFRREAGA